MQNHLEILTSITGMLVQANVGVPIIFGAIAAISSIIKGLTGTGPNLVQIASLIEGQLNTNDKAIREEIDRLKANIGAVKTAKK